jgi:uncharacterized membrane protein
MKLSHIIIVLLIFSYPLYYLYGLQLGAISFLLLAIFFSVIAMKELKKLKVKKERDQDQAKREKIN